MKKNGGEEVLQKAWGNLGVAGSVDVLMMVFTLNNFIPSSTHMAKSACGVKTRISIPEAEERPRNGITWLPTEIHSSAKKYCRRIVGAAPLGLP